MPAHRRFRCLGDKHRRHCQIQCRSIEVERITGRHNEADNVPRHAQAFHLFHRPGQGRFAAGSGKGERGRLAHGAHELSQRHARDRDHAPENQQDENDQGQIKRQNQAGQIKKHAQPLGPDGVRHGCADAKGRKHHHVIGELKHDLRKALHRAHDWPPFFADRRDGQRK